MVLQRKRTLFSGCQKWKYLKYVDSGCMRVHLKNCLFWSLGECSGGLHSTCQQQFPRENVLYRHHFRNVRISSLICVSYKSQKIIFKFVLDVKKWCDDLHLFVHKEIAHHQCCLIPMADFGVWCLLLLFSLCYSNVGEALVGKGLATVVRYRMEDDQRSEHYDELLAAEARAQKKGVGLHSKKEAPIHRVADVSGVSGFVWKKKYGRKQQEISEIKVKVVTKN